MSTSISNFNSKLVHAWQGKRVLVTGGSGFIGRQVLKVGLKAGVELHSISRSEVSLREVHLHSLTICDREGVQALIRKIRPQGVLHLAAAGVVYQSATLAAMMLINAVGTVNLLDAIETAELSPHVVIAGSGAEYKPQERCLTEEDTIAPISAYGVSKAAATHCAELYAARMPVTLLRLFNVYGSGENETRLVPSLIAAARKNESVELTNCEQIRDYTYVEDAAESFWRALLAPPAYGKLRVLNVGTGERIPLRSFVLTLVELLEKKGVRPRILFGAKPSRLDEPKVYAPSIERMRTLLDWIPQTKISEGLCQTLELESGSLG